MNPDFERGQNFADASPPTKAAVNAPQSRRFAPRQAFRLSRSVWTAVALAPLSPCQRRDFFEPFLK